MTALVSPSPAVQDWDDVIVCAWLTAWGVEPDIVHTLKDNGVHGHRLISLYWDITRGAWRKTSEGPCWSHMFPAADFRCIIALTDPVPSFLVKFWRPMTYAAELDFLLPTGPWVRFASSLLSPEKQGFHVRVFFAVFFLWVGKNPLADGF